jgi:hypothetical protein
MHRMSMWPRSCEQCGPFGNQTTPESYRGIVPLHEALPTTRACSTTVTMSNVR